jgi:hypothetical protein
MPTHELAPLISPASLTTNGQASARFKTTQPAKNHHENGHVDLDRMKVHDGS